MIPQNSMSRLNIAIEVYGKGRAEGEVFRHLAPMTMNSLLRNVPLQGRVIRFRDQFVYVTSGIIVGVEKARKRFQKGEIGFISSNGALCFFLKDCDVAMPINLLGKITFGLDILVKAGAGDVVSVTISQKA
ncbi:MAG: cyclophilin-like family protein [Nitrososphaerales archaeon]